MARYRLITFVDITRTQADRNETDLIKVRQQSNFNSLTQAIGLRSNINWSKDPKKMEGRLPDGIEGKAVHWIWEFETERDDVFLKDDDPAGLLKEDLHGVPVVDGLENSVELSPQAFQTKNGNQNTWVFDL